MSLPLIVVLRLEDHGIFEEFNQHLLNALARKALVRNAKTAPEARRFLTSSARPFAVLVADAAVASPEYRDVLLHLVQYANAGGTVVYAGIFSSFVRRYDLDFMFKTAWGLPWHACTYTREDFIVNPRSYGINVKELVRKYSMKATFVGGVALVCGGKTSAQVAATYKTPAAFASIGKGRVGYVGDVHAERGTTSLILAMCFHPKSRVLIAPGTGILLAGHSASPPAGAQSSSAEARTTQRNILIVSIEKDDWIDDLYSQLYSALRANATVTEVVAPRAATQALSSTPRPDAVLVSDAGITRAEHASVLNRLIEYARAGGTVILGMQFSNHLPLGDAGAFYSKWGVSWDAGSYHRTTFALNPAGIPEPLAMDALLPSFSMKVLHVKHAPRACAVYLPTSESRVESHVFAPAPITGDRAEESPAVFARVGEGYLGYVGDVNGEQGSLRLIVEMCGVKIQLGDMGPRTFSSGVSILPDGRVESIKETEEEIPLPTPAPPTRAPRALEADVEARAARRAHVRDGKIAQADSLKTEGNELFRTDKWAEAADKYRAAAFLGGPCPVYLSNLAAALLKMKLWADAESAASRALEHDPKHIKSLYRRALARKEQDRFTAAEADINHMLVQDRTNAAALSEREILRALKAAMEPFDWPGDEALPPQSMKIALEIEDESDSEDFAHAGNGIPCKFFNHDGCLHGEHCRFKHAPDSMSVRDELDRNVCVYWLLGECRFGQRCVYAHDGTYLPPRGWWTDTDRLSRMRKEFEDVVTAHPLAGVSERLLPEALKPMPWRKDLWAEATYDREVAVMAEAEEDERAREEDEEDRWDEEDWEERAFGYTNDDVEEMLMYGLKPWDLDASDELMSIREALEHF